ncbi:unnamed protein product, partial [Porites lobata]
EFEGVLEECPKSRPSRIPVEFDRSNGKFLNSNITLLVDSKLTSGKDCWNLSSLGQDAERFFTPDIAPDPIIGQLQLSLPRNSPQYDVTF